MDMLNKKVVVIAPFGTLGGTRFSQGDRMTVVDYQEGEYLLQRDSDGKRAYVYKHEFDAYLSE